MCDHAILRRIERESETSVAESGGGDLKADFETAAYQTAREGGPVLSICNL